MPDCAFTSLRDRLRASFSTVETWIFDLDNTLYPVHTNLFDQIERRITKFIANYLKVDGEEAFRLQKDYYRRYGTSLRGMMAEHGMPPHAFLDYVHDIDHSALEPDPDLTAALASLPGRKFVLTNGSRGHAENVTRKLGIDHHFEAMFGIVEAEFTPKPAREPFDMLVKNLAFDPRGAVMFEDIARNLEVPKQMGMSTVLIVERSVEDAAWRGDWELAEREAPYVDFESADLPRFLLSVCDAVNVEKDLAGRPIPQPANTAGT